MLPNASFQNIDGNSLAKNLSIFIIRLNILMTRIINKQSLETKNGCIDKTEKNNPTPFISIVMINYNGKSYLEETLPPILNLNYPNYEIIVADNGSTDGSINFLKSLKKIKLIESERIGEKNYACNIGILKSKGEYILLMDNDLLITDSNLLKNLLLEEKHLNNWGSLSLAFENRGEKLTNGYGGFFCLYYSYAKPNIRLDEISQMHGTTIGSPNGSGFFIKKELWDRLEGYDDHLPFGGDDDDLGLKLWLYGYSNYLYSKSIQIHIGMPERTDTYKYSDKLQKKTYAHMYTIVKNFRLINVFITLIIYIIYTSAKAIKQSIKRRSIKPLTSTVIGYFTFFKNIPTALKKRKKIQKNRIIKTDIFFKIRPKFIKKHSRINVFMQLFR